MSAFYRGIWPATKTVFIVAVIGLGGPSWSQTERGQTQPRCEDATLRVWHTESDPQAQAALGKLIANFTRREKAEGGCNVVVEALGIPWGALATKLSTALTAGSEPDIAHLEPFMAYSLIRRNKIEPIDDVVTAVEAENGPILPAVRDLQRYGGKHYALAYAVGSTFFAYRKDWAKAGGWSGEPQNWKDILRLAQALQAGAAKLGVPDAAPDAAALVLPGASPFFIDQLAVELLASAGGTLFSGAMPSPNLNNDHFRRMLKFYQELVRLAHPDWMRVDYQSQFEYFAKDRVGMVLVTYGRAIKALTSVRGAETSDETFGVFPQPAANGPSDGHGYATIDAEPWAIFRNSNNKDLAKRFLKAFYAKPDYLEFCRTVPLHLMPIFPNLWAQARTAEFEKHWSSWVQLAETVLTQNRVRPIFMAGRSDEEIPYLMQMQQDRVITDAVMGVGLDGLDIEAAATQAQAAADRNAQRFR